MEAEGLVTETWSKDRALLVEVTDVADVKAREPDIQVDNDVGDVTRAPVVTEMSRSWCEHGTLALERVNCSTILLWCSSRASVVSTMSA